MKFSSSSNFCKMFKIFDWVWLRKQLAHSLKIAIQIRPKNCSLAAKATARGFICEKTASKYHTILDNYSLDIKFWFPRFKMLPYDALCSINFAHRQSLTNRFWAKWYKDSEQIRITIKVVMYIINSWNYIRISNARQHM